jgi:hypothetical protein
VDSVQVECQTSAVQTIECCPYWEPVKGASATNYSLAPYQNAAISQYLRTGYQGRLLIATPGAQFGVNVRAFAGAPTVSGFVAYTPLTSF